MKQIILFLILVTTTISAQDIQEQIWQLYLHKNYNELHKVADEYLEEDANHASVNLMKGRALVDVGKFLEGKPYIEKAIENDPNHSWITAWAINYLGIIEYLSGNREAAVKNFNDCISMNATKNVTKTANGNLTFFGDGDFYKDWQKVETDHFTFLFQPNTIVNDTKAFADLREDAFIKINSFFNSSIPMKINFIVWNGNEDAKAIGIKQPLGFARPELCLIHSRPNQTLGHEITHVISNYYKEAISKTKFINEGIAVAFDQTSEDKLVTAQRLKSESNTTDKISIKAAWEEPGKYPEWVYYQLAGEFIHRLIDKGGKDKFLQFVNNQSYSNAEAIYGKLLDKIIEDLESDIN